MITRRPDPSEFAPFYAGYVAHVPDGPIVETLRAQREANRRLIASIPESREDYRYAPGKWTVREVVGHVLDAERVFGYRALHFARQGGGEIPGMDQDAFNLVSGYLQRPLASIAEELYQLRSANIEQYRWFDEETLDRKGTASGAVMSVRALLFVMAGHERHHMNVLAERYL